MGRIQPRLLPAGAVGVFAVAVLLGYGTGWSAVLRFGLLLGAGITLPGTLCWRALRGNVDGFAADVSFGTGLGLAVSTLIYLPARAVGVPLLVLLFPVVTIGLFVARPGLRRHWRSAGPVMPRWWSWLVALACLGAVAVVVRNGLALEPASFPGAAFGYVDLPYHLALAAELKHHVPPQVPYVAGEPLRYHWFVYAQLASMNWQSGIPLELLLVRLLPLLLAVLPVAGIASLSTRLSGRPAAGPVAAWLLVLVSSLDVYGWNGAGGVAVPNQFSTGVLILSPTHAFGVPILLATVWVAASLLRGTASRGSWVLLGVGLAGLAGAKVTFVPLLLAGALLALLVSRSRRAFAIVGGCVVVAGLSYVLLYSGGAAGTGLDLAGTVRMLGPRLGLPHVLAGDRVAVVSSTVTFAVSWGAAAVGMLGLFRYRRDPAVALLAGFVLAGLGTTFVYSQFSGSQLYFARAAFPIAICGSAWGLSRITFRWAVVAVLAGVGTAVVVIGLTRHRPSEDVVWDTTWPWLAVLLVAVVLGLVTSRIAVAALVVLAASCVSVPVTVASFPASHACPDGPERRVCRPRQVPVDGDLAARFVRSHSSPGDVIATNAHCVPGTDCDTRAFWLAGYAERRVLLEGWAYTNHANSYADQGASPIRSPFWDPGLKAANDAVFTKPTRENLAVLRDRYGVRWLVFDRSVSREPPSLERLASLRYAAGPITVYSLP